MTWKERLIGLPLAALGALLLLGTAAGMTVTRTDRGREQLRRVAIEQLNRRVNGRIEVDAFLEGDLLRRVRLAGVRIEQRDGRRIASIDTLELEYRWADLLIGDIAFESVTMVGPVLNFSLSPDGSWNFEEIFRSGGSGGSTVRANGTRREIVLRRVAIRAGDVSVRMPWADDGSGAGENQSWRIQESEGRLERVFRIERLNATLPIARLAARRDVGELLQIAQFNGRVDVYRKPIDVEQLRADVEIRGDTITFDVWEIGLPESRLFGRGAVTLGDVVDYDISLRGAPVGSRDFLWLEPRLPEGVAQLDFRIRRLAGGLTVEATNADWESEEAKLSGRFAMKLRDGSGETEFDRVELEIERFSSSLIQTATGWEPPLAGEIAGRLDLDGPLSELSLYADLRFEPDGPEPPTRLSADGTVFGIREELGGSALLLKADTLPLELVRAFLPGLEIRGELGAELRLEGRLADELAVYFDLEHRDRDLAASRIRGGGLIQKEPEARARVDLAALAEPLSLSTLSEYYPLIPFRGDLDGSIRARGTLEELELETHLGGGRGDSIHVRGEFQLAGEGPAYQGEIRGSRVAQLGEGLKGSNLDFRIDLAGRGAQLDVLETRGHVEVYSSFVGDVQIDTGFADLRVAASRLHVDTAVLSGEFGEFRAGGALGLVPDVVDTLTFDLEADSLGGLNRWLRPGFEPLTRPVLATDGDGPGGALVETARLEGYARATGFISGSSAAPLVRVNVEGQGLSYGALGAESLHITGFEAADFGKSPTLRGALESSGTVIGGVRVDRLKLSGELVDSVATAEFEADAERAGRAEGRAWVRLEKDARTLGLESLSLELENTSWRLAGPTQLRLAESGALAIEAFQLESSKGHVQLDGSIEATGLTSFTVDVRGVDLAELAALWSDTAGVAGVLTLRSELSGRSRDPLVEARLEVTDGHLQGVSFSALRSTLGYGSGDLSLDAGMWVGNDQLFRLDGSFPVDLTLPELGVELPKRAIRMAFEGDSIPLSLLSATTDEISDANGYAKANVLIRGHPEDVSLVGTVDLFDAGLHVVSTGVSYRGLEGQLLLKESSMELSDVSFEGSSRGRGRLSGTIDIADLRQPVFDLGLEAEGLPAYAKPEVTVAVSGSARLRGPYEKAVFDGDLSVVQGVLSVEEIGRRREVINPFSEELLLLEDLFRSGDDRPRSGKNPFLNNLTVELNVSVESDTWVREICAIRAIAGCGAEKANVGIGGDLTARGQPWQDSLRITGTLQALRGDYKILSKRFRIVEGTLEFVGTPGFNPNINIVGTHTVRTRQRTLEIRAVITGTFEEPQLRFESDAPISESDLLSYVLFGRPTYEITRAGAGEGSIPETLVSGALGSVVGSSLESLLAGGTGLDFQVSQAPTAVAPGAANYRGFAPALAATQVEVGWYLAPTVFVSVGQQLIGAVAPTVQVEWRLRNKLTVRGITEPRFAREARLYPQTADLAQTYGVFLFYGWSY